MPVTTQVKTVQSESPLHEAGTFIRASKNYPQFVPPKNKPSFDDEVLKPLYGAQAERARLEAIQVAQRLEAERKAKEAAEAAQATQQAPEQPTTQIASTPTPSPTPQPPTDVIGIITYWANVNGIDPNWAIRIARCESTLNPLASNGNHFGLYQFLSSTYAAYAPSAGAGGDYWDANNNARTATYMLAHGMANQWTCK